jgi:hypothetical protein
MASRTPAGKDTSATTTSNTPTDDAVNPAATDAGDATLASPAATDPDVVSNPEPVGDSAKAMQAEQNAGFHDSLSGRPVDQDGRFLDVEGAVEDAIPAHRIVANDWPNYQGSSQGRVEDPAVVEGDPNAREHTTR